MAEVKWFKVLTDMFSDDKIKIIQSMPEGDSLIVMWFKVLAQAGKTNDGGYIYLKKNIPYTPGMLSTLFNKPQQIVELALRTFSEFGMIDMDDRGYIFITNWEKHQNIAGMEKVREQTRKRVSDHRERKRLELQSPTLNCVYCGGIGESLDHIIPRSKGGKDVPENCVPACKSCNSSKKDKDLSDFLNDSIYLNYQNVNFDLVLKNEKLMRYIEYVDGKFTMKRNSNVTVTQGNGTELDKELDKEKESSSSPQNVFELYQNTIGMISPTIAEMLGDNINTYGEISVCEAIKEAARQGKNKLSYVEGILRKWHTDGRSKGPKTKVAHHDLPTEAEVRAAERRKQDEMDNLNFSDLL